MKGAFVVRPYPEYKETEYDWVGDIPSHWKLAQLKFVAPRITEKANGNGRHDVQITLENVESHTGRLLGSSTFEGIGNQFEKGDVLYNKLRPYLNKAVLALSSGVAVGELLVLRPADQLDGRFLLYRLLENGFMSIVDGSTYGAKMPRANWDFIGAIKIPAPPLSEQHAIVNFLDRKTAQIDDLIAKKQRQIELLQEHRAALINQAVTKGLNPDAPMKDSGVEWLGAVPAHWEIRRNGVLFNQRDERNFPELPLLHVSIHTGVTLREFSDDRVEQIASDWTTYKKAHEGDIVFNKMRLWQGAVGVAPQDGLVSSDYTVAAPNQDVNPYYFEFLFRTAGYKLDIDRNSRGIVPDRNRLYWDEFKQMRSLFPPPEEQDQIVCQINNNAAIIKSETGKLQREIELVKEYRIALISAAVMGKIDVREEAGS